MGSGVSEDLCENIETDCEVTGGQVCDNSSSIVASSSGPEH